MSFVLSILCQLSSVWFLCFRMKLICSLFLALVALANADVYFHSPRGSNNRLNEHSANRDNANRLFDSQVRMILFLIMMIIEDGTWSQSRHQQWWPGDPWGQDIISNDDLVTHGARTSAVMVWWYISSDGLVTHGARTSAVMAWWHMEPGHQQWWPGDTWSQDISSDDLVTQRARTSAVMACMVTHGARTSAVMAWWHMEPGH